MIHLAVLYVRQGLAYQLMDGLLLLHGGYIQIRAHVVDPIDGADDAGGASAEQFQQLNGIKANRIESNRVECDQYANRTFNVLSTYASLVEQIRDHGHGNDALAHLELAPLLGHGQDRVARNAGQYETVQRRCYQFLF